MTFRIVSPAAAIAVLLAGCTTTRSYESLASSPAAPAPQVRTTGEAEDAPEISRSAGEEGGIILFWPRVIEQRPAGSSRELAAAVQQLLRDMVTRAFPGRPIDVRPEPERVCPQGGCRAMGVGALLLREQNGCAVIALLSRPGTSPTTMIRWAGRIRMPGRAVPFREPPESYITVTDFTPCPDLIRELREGQGAVEDALLSVAR